MVLASFFSTDTVSLVERTDDFVFLAGNLSFTPLPPLPSHFIV